MPLYEVLTIARAGLPPGEYTELVRSCFRTLSANGGVLRSVENFGRLPLAYRVRAHQRYHRRGQFIRLRMDANAQTMGDLEHALRVNENVIRWLKLRRPTLPLPPKVKRDPGAFGELGPEKSRELFFQRVQSVDKMVAIEIKRMLERKFDSLLPHDVEPTLEVKREVLVHGAKKGAKFDDRLFAEFRAEREAQEERRRAQAEVEAAQAAQEKQGEQGEK